MPEPITAIVSNPKVAYRLDPDEPGLARPASATNSAYTVVAQESHNRARLKSQALLRGDQVVLLKTDYKVQRVGSFNVVVGGLTTIVTRERSGDTGAQSSPPAPRGNSQQIAQLTAELARLERERSSLEKSESGKEAYQISSEKARAVVIDQRLAEIRAELRKLGVNTAAGNLSPAAAFAAHGFAATLDSTGQLLDLLA